MLLVHLFLFFFIGVQEIKNKNILYLIMLRYTDIQKLKVNKFSDKRSDIICNNLIICIIDMNNYSAPMRNVKQRLIVLQASTYNEYAIEI